MSIKSTGSIAGLAGCVGNLQAGQGLAEFSRQLTRGDEYEPHKQEVDWVTHSSLPAYEPSNYWN